MTTVAFDGKTLATDSQATSSAGIFGAKKRSNIPYQKIYTPPEGERWTIYNKRILAIGICGSTFGIFQLLEELKKGIGLDTKGKQTPETDCIAIVDDGSFFILVNNGNYENWYFDLVPAGNFYAMGSGAAEAKAFMTIGRKAPAAIKEVMKIDLGTGGEIQTWDFPEVVPEDVKPVEVPADQQALYDAAKKKIDEIAKEALITAQKKIDEAVKLPEPKEEAKPATTPATSTADAVAE